MAKLGDAFSESERKKSALRRLVPGAVVYLEVAFPEGRKNKFLVVASVEAECCTFVINSRVHPFFEAREELSVCQVRLDAARHEFLRRDSWIACHSVLMLQVGDHRLRSMRSRPRSSARLRCQRPSKHAWSNR